MLLYDSFYCFLFSDSSPGKVVNSDSVYAQVIWVTITILLTQVQRDLWHIYFIHMNLLLFPYRRQTMTMLLICILETHWYDNNIKMDIFIIDIDYLYYLSC